MDLCSEFIEKHRHRLRGLYGLLSESTSQSIISINSLLDLLLALHTDLSCISKKSEFITNFLKQNDAVISKIKSLRVNTCDFDRLRTLATGAIGKVCLVKCKATKDVYAMKILKKSDLITRREAAFYMQERNALIESGLCSWITTLYTSFQDEENLYLVMEYAPGGSLRYLIDKNDGMMKEEDVRFYVAEIILGIEAVHTMKYIHRDIKPDNCLIDRNGHVKLADFGSCISLMEVNEHIHAHDTVGTPDYVSPEVLRLLEGNISYGPECDWWSLGIIMYELLYDDVPFYSESLVETYSRIMDHQKYLKFEDPPGLHISKEAVELMSKLITDKEKRLGVNGAHEIKRHPWFNGFCWDNVRSLVPPFVPELSGPDDTRYFEEGEPVERKFISKGKIGGGQFNGENLAFVGYSYFMNLDNVDIVVPGPPAHLDLSENKHNMITPTSEPLVSSVDKSPVSLVYSESLNDKSNDLAISNERIKTLEASLIQSQNTVSKLSEECSDKSKVLEGLYEELYVLKEKIIDIERIKQELEMTVKSKEALVKEVASLTEEVSVIRKSNSKLEQAHNMAKVEIERLNELVNTMEKDREASKLNFEKLLNMAHTENETSISDLETKNATLTEQISSLNRELSTIYDTYSKETCEKAKLHFFVNELSDFFTRHIKPTPEFPSEIELHVEKLLELFKSTVLKVKNSTTETDKLNRFNTSFFNVRSKELSGELGQSPPEQDHSASTTSCRNYMKLQVMCNEKDKKFQDIENEVNKLRGEIHKLRIIEGCHNTTVKSLDRTMDEIKKLKLELAAKTLELETVTGNLFLAQSTCSNIEKKYKIQSERIEAHFDEARSLRETIKRLEDNIVKCGQTMTNLKKEKLDLENICDQKVCEILDCRAIIKDLEKSLEETKITCGLKDAKILNLQEQIEDMSQVNIMLDPKGDYSTVRIGGRSINPTVDLSTSTEDKHCSRIASGIYSFKNVVHKLKCIKGNLPLLYKPDNTSSSIHGTDPSFNETSNSSIDAFDGQSIVPTVATKGSLSSKDSASSNARFNDNLTKTTISGILKVPKSSRIASGWTTRFAKLENYKLYLYEKDKHQDSEAIQVEDLCVDLLVVRCVRINELIHTSAKTASCAFKVYAANIPESKENKRISICTKGDYSPFELLENLKVEKNILGASEKMWALSSKASRAVLQNQILTSKKRISDYKKRISMINHSSDDGTTDLMDTDFKKSLAEHIDTCKAILQNKIELQNNRRSAILKMNLASVQLTSQCAAKKNQNDKVLSNFQEKLDQCDSVTRSLKSDYEGLDVTDDRSRLIRILRKWLYIENDNHGVNDHLFKEKVCYRPTDCDVCQETIWSIEEECYECSECKMFCHLACKKLVPLSCSQSIALRSVTPKYYVAASVQERDEWISAIERHHTEYLYNKFNPSEDRC